LSPRCQ